MGDAFYRRDGGLLLATELTRGPWNDLHQHGGPPAAVLGGAIESAGDDAASFRLARITVELLRPVPIAALRLTTEVVKSGRQVQRIAASLWAEGVEVARALGVRIRRASLAIQAPPAAPVLPPPDSGRVFAFPFFTNPVGYQTAVDIRFVRGEWGQSEVDLWMRPRVAIVEGEEPTPVQRVLSVVDAESGVCPPIDPMLFGFPNPDLTVYFARAPRGQWVGLQAHSVAGPDGIGLAQSALSDEDGVFGRALQSLVIAPR